jgi:hypothetical protein
MARRTTEELSDSPLSLVFVAGNVVDAETAEGALTRVGIDYAISLEPYATTNPFGFGAVYQGLFFYVPHCHLERCRQLLESHGLKTVDPEWSEEPE